MVEHTFEGTAPTEIIRNTFKDYGIITVDMLHIL